MNLKNDLLKASLFSANRIRKNTTGIVEFFLNFKSLINSINFETISTPPKQLNIYHRHELAEEINKIDKSLQLCMDVCELADEICENAIDLTIAVNTLKNHLIKLCNEES
jgi:hypothetical protein